MSAEKKLIVIGGPTASGKTKLAIALAKHLDTDIISADSRQFFREMSIGTAKPDSEELQQAKHHFIGHLSIQDRYSVGDFERDALDLLDKIFQKKDWAIVVGGSGLYIKALCEGLDDFPPVPTAIRDAVQQDFDTHGLSQLLAELKLQDPVYFETVDRNNPARIIRAVSFIRVHQRPFSAFQGGTKKERPFQSIFITPYWPRQVLYERINTRVDQMMENGLLEEVIQLKEFKSLNAMQTVGYQEIFKHLDGELELSEAVALIQQNSRRYAKRQLTWLRKEQQWRRIQAGNTEKALAFIDALQSGASWRSQQLDNGFRLLLGMDQEEAQLDWLQRHHQHIAVLHSTSAVSESLMIQLTDQAFALAEENNFYLAAEKSWLLSQQLEPLEVVPDWLLKLEAVGRIEDLAVYQRTKIAQ